MSTLSGHATLGVRCRARRLATRSAGARRAVRHGRQGRPGQRAARPRARPGLRWQGPVCPCPWPRWQGGCAGRPHAPPRSRGRRTPVFRRQGEDRPGGQGWQGSDRPGPARGQGWHGSARPGPVRGCASPRRRSQRGCAGHAAGRRCAGSRSRRPLPPVPLGCGCDGTPASGLQERNTVTRLRSDPAYGGHTSSLGPCVRWRCQARDVRCLRPGHATADCVRGLACRHCHSLGWPFSHDPADCRYNVFH